MPDTKTIERRKTAPRDRPKPKRQPPYHVILLDDNDHTYDYVIEMCRKVFGYPLEKGLTLAKEVDATGRVILLTTTLEHAELKRDQCSALGPDWRLDRSAGAMTIILEPAED